MFFNVSILSLELGKISLRKHHASLTYLGKTTGGDRFGPPGLLRVKHLIAVSSRWPIGPLVYVALERLMIL